MADITTTTTHGPGAGPASATDLHLQCGGRITGQGFIMVLDLDSTMAALTTVEDIIVGDWFYNKG